MMNALYRHTIPKHEAVGTTIQIYMNDIAIATKNPSLSFHKAAMSDMLQVAKDNSLFFKLSKSVFHALAINYLRVILEKWRTRMEPTKVFGVCNWPTPKSVKDICSFDGFCNFYHAFIAGFSKVALPPNVLTKMGSPSCEQQQPNRHSTH